MEKCMWKPVSYKSNPNSSQKPCPRWGHSCCTVGTDIVLFGGYAESVYMNDLWVFDTLSMQWSEIKTKGTIPLPRSNASASYDHKNNRIIFFGGGGSNKMRYNSITILDWETKTWSEIQYKENQILPWERTYHTAELLYPYLIVYGGQGIADLDDLWVYNFETSLWREIKTPKDKVRPNGRRFHSSCLIGKQFFIIAGCHTKYRCLNDIFSIDLTQLLETGETENLKWRERSIKGTALLSRWGHSSASFDNKIYIFGGRFSTDLNDLLIFDPVKQTLKILKVSSDSLPKPRRRPSTCFVGSCLLMFGGFNSEYYNDLHFINIADNFVKPKSYKEQLTQQEKTAYIRNLLKLSPSKDYDYYLQSSDQDLVPCFKDLLNSSFEDWDKIEDFLISINGQYPKERLEKIVESLYLGYCGIQNLSLFQSHKINMPIDEQQKIRETRRRIEQKVLVSSSFEGIVKSKLSNGIIQLDDQKFGQMIQKNRESIKKDVVFVINNSFVLETNRNLLSLNSKFFRALLNNYNEKHKNQNQQFIRISIPTNNIVLFEIVLNSIIFGILTLPIGMSYQSWMELFSLADYFCMQELRKVCVYQLSLRIEEYSVEAIYNFAKLQKIDDLGLLCAKYKMNNMAFLSEKSLKQPYIKEVYELLRFQILQRDIIELQPKIHKHKSEITRGSSGEKENYEVCN